MPDERPLAGIRVLDLSRLLPGPYATMVLADLGASVDKVEDPGAGDYMRVMPPLVGGMNATFQTLNRGKRSAVLDLKKPAGRDALLRLVERYDVLVESFRPGVMERLGLGWSALHERNPQLVVCAITGYGQDGPMASKAGHDLNYLARAGVLGFTGPEAGPPQVPGVQVADIGGGAMFAVVGILAALQARQRTGQGRFVDVSMCEGSLAFALFGISQHLGGNRFPAGGETLMGGLAPYNTYRTKDGGAVALGALEPKFWMAFCASVGLEPAMEALLPGPHQAEWKQKIGDVIVQKTRAEWADFARTVDCCLEVVLQPEELADDPQHRARDMFVQMPTADGLMTQPRTPIAHDVPAAAAPRHGEHTEAILAEVGLTLADVS